MASSYMAEKLLTVMFKKLRQSVKFLPDHLEAHTIFNICLKLKRLPAKLQQSYYNAVRYGSTAPFCRGFV